MRLTRTLGTLSIAALVFGLAACGDDDDASDDTTTTTAADVEDPGSDTTEADADDDVDDDDDDTGPADGGTPAWANPFEVTGDLLTTIEGEGFTVDVYQVGTAAAPKDGMFIDPSTNEPILKAGDELVYVLYVATNTSGDTIQLPFNLVNVTARYADWQWAQGMDGSSDRALYEEMGIPASAIATGNTEAPFPWAPGESFAYGDNFKHQPGSDITFSAVLTPADADGDLVHDDRVEAEADTTIR